MLGRISAAAGARLREGLPHIQFSPYRAALLATMPSLAGEQLDVKRQVAPSAEPKSGGSMNTMTRTLQVMLIALAAFPSAHASPADEAKAAFSNFFPAFVAYNQADVAAMFAPDAQFYGTLSTELVLTPDGVLKYFVASLDRPDIARATPLQLNSTALSESIVLIAGSWKLDRTLNGKTTSTGPYRLTAVMQKRDGRWVVAQFHNSPLPVPAPVQPAASR
jgi:hypothetical protein